MSIGITIESVRVNGRDHAVTTIADLQEMASVINACLKWMGSEPRSPQELLLVAPPATALARPNRPAAGERAVDYLEKAVAILDRYFTVANVLDAMMAAGWVTKSKTRSIALSQVRQLIKADSRFVSDGTGYWIFEPSGVARPE